VTHFADRELRERFAAMRAADRASARGVLATIDRAPPKRRVRPASRALILVAWTSVLVLAVGLWRRDGRPLAPAVVVSEWQPATDVLLRSARSPMLGPMPPLGASVLDQYLRTPSR
jgi:hypothetical protein